MEEEKSRRGRRPKPDAKVAQINIRMDPTLKTSGDAVLSRLGVTPSDAVRALYEYLASEQDLPEGLAPKHVVAQTHWAAENAGLALRLLQGGER